MPAPAHGVFVQNGLTNLFSTDSVDKRVCPYPKRHELGTKLGQAHLSIESIDSSLLTSKRANVPKCRGARCSLRCYQARRRQRHCQRRCGFTVAQRWPRAVNRANWRTEPSSRSVGRTTGIRSLGCGSGGQVTDAEVITNPGNVSPLDNRVAHGLQQAAFRSRTIAIASGIHEP